MNSNSTVSGENKSMCPICRYNDPLDRQVLDCGHEFHSECLVPWARQCNTCPICRRAIDTSVPVSGCPFLHIDEDRNHALDLLQEEVGDDFDEEEFMQVIMNSIREQSGTGPDVVNWTCLDCGHRPCRCPIIDQLSDSENSFDYDSFMG